MKKIIFGIFSLAFCSNVLFAQDENDAIRYGNTSYFGTSRGLAIGTALGSVGGDFSTISVNPAGLGVFRRGEFSFTPSFTVNNNEAGYLGSNATSNENKLNFSQIGLVLTKAEKEFERKRKWKAASFAVGMNRLSNFKNTFAYEGDNNKSSIVNKWANDFNALGGLNNNTLNSVNYPAYAAYETYLIDRDNVDSTKAKSYVPLDGKGIRQTKNIEESGGMQEYVIAGGGNYLEKLLIGGSVGIVNVRYNRSTQYREDDISGNDSNYFKYLKFNESLVTEGTGFNLKLGVIYKFNKLFRMGFAVHTPTYIEFTDQSRISMESHTETLLSTPISNYNQDTAQAFNYSQTTPYKAIASATLLFNQMGFLTADVEYVDYGSMNYNFGVGYESLSNDMNATIDRTYRSTTNVRVGIEGKIKDISLRAGFAYYGSPYQNAAWKASRQNLSVGIGYRAKNWFMDLVYVYSKMNTYENPYILTNGSSPLATIVKNTSNVAFSVGWKF